MGVPMFFFLQMAEDTFLNISTPLVDCVQLDLVAKAIVEGFMTGLHRSPYHGFSVEYAEHRMYNPGDSTRHIDWKMYAKTQRLYTRCYEEETNLRAYFAVDTSSSMYYPENSYDKMRFITYATAALAYLLQRQRDGVGFFAFSDSVTLEIPAKSTQTHLQTLFHTLSRLSPPPKEREKTNISKSLHDIAKKIPRRSLVIVFSDLLLAEDPSHFWSALQHVRHGGHDVLLFHVRDQQTEKNLLFESRPYVFHALEDTSKVHLNPEEVRALYSKRMQAWEEELQNRCGTMGVDYFAVDTQENFNRTLHACLLKRMRM